MKQILDIESIKVNLPSVSKKQAIIDAGESLFEKGYIAKEYVQAMLDREEKVSTYIGNHIAIPHGTEGSGKYVKHTCLVVHHYKDGVLFDKEFAHFIIAIASNSEEHIDILASIAENFSDIDEVNKLINSNITKELIWEKFKGSK